MSDMLAAEPTSPAAKRPLGAKRVMPKPWALEEAYRRYAKGGILLAAESAKGSRRRGKDYLTKDQIMRVIGQESASAWGHINKARNALDVESALLLAKTLEVPVDQLFDIHEAAARHLRGKQREQLRKDREEWTKRWSTKMQAFPLPLERAAPLQVVDWVAEADRIVFVNSDDEFGCLDLSTAQLADDFKSRIALAKKVGRLTAGKQLEDYLAELSQVAKWGILAARYVERICWDDEPDDFGNLDVRASKVLVLKLSTKPGEPGHEIDRTKEYDGESNAEAACDREDYREFEELAAWVAPYRFWEEVRR